MHIVGLTGGIGAGKTFVADMFARFGVPIYNADARAKYLMNNHGTLINIIKETFGSDMYKQGTLDRKALADIVFNDVEKLKILNELVHPPMERDHEAWHKEQDAVYTIKEAAILFESGANRGCDKIITVTAPLELRLNRVMKRDELSREEVLARMSNQWDDELKVAKSDYVITNDEKHMVMPQVLKIHKELLVYESDRF